MTTTMEDKPATLSVSALLKRWNAWQVTWVTMQISSLRQRHARSYPVEVPFRECPHGGYFMDERIAPPMVINAWGILDGLPQCPESPSGICSQAYRANNVRGR